MLQWLVFRFWPAWIPLLVYLLWHWKKTHAAHKAGAPLPRFRDGPWFSTLIACLIIAILCFILIGAENKELKGEYVPPHMEGGKLVPGITRQVQP